MDLVAAAQLIFPVVCTDAGLLSNCSAHVTEIVLCCCAFASLDQKFPVASSHLHSSISSTSAAKESHNHSSTVRFDPASRIFAPRPHVACISRHAATTLVSVLPWTVCFPYQRVSSAIERERTRLLDEHRDRHAWRLWVSGPSNGR